MNAQCLITSVLDMLGNTTPNLNPQEDAGIMESVEETVHSSCLMEERSNSSAMEMLMRK